MDATREKTSLARRGNEPGDDTPQALALSILNSLDAAVYVADMQTHELLFINDHMRTLFGDVSGQICWQAIQSDQAGPCSFCTNGRLVDGRGQSTGPYKWEFRNTRNGHWYQIIDRAIPWMDGRLVRLEIAFDITSRKEAERAMAHRASYDSLTELLNRRETQVVLEKVHAEASRSQQPYSLLLLDLDRFKLINDSHGHRVGDEALWMFARTAERAIRKDDWIGRWGGEEFLCILPHTEPHTAQTIAERLRRDVEAIQLLDGKRPVRITTSIGLASYPADADTPAALLSHADSALYEAKRGGRNRIQSCEETGIFSIASQLDTALRENRICAAYQPIVDLYTGQQVAEEALARIRLGEGLYWEAGHFISAASNLHLAHRIDYQLILATMLRCSLLVNEGHVIKHFVNISADFLRHPELMQEVVTQAVAACKACGDRIGQEKPLVMEITERELLGDIKNARKALAPLLDFGLQLAIDDFGSGYSSFQYLADLPIAYLKMEGALVRRAATEPRILAILKGIQDIAHDLALITVAEHIEDEATLDAMRGLGVNWGQGYLLGRPQV